MLKNKFDLVISIGEDCACAMFLNKTHLRTASYPMDWLCHATFEQRINLICNNFDHFLEKSNMKWFPKPSRGLRDLENENYEDTATGFYFYHDFPSNMRFEESFPTVKEKYNRRIARFYRNINKAKNVLLVWWSRDKIIKNRILLQAQNKISNRFGKDIYLLAIENNPNSAIQEIRLSDFVTKYTANIIGNTTTTLGLEETSIHIFSKIPYQKVQFKKILAKILTLFIPIKKWRKNIRKHMIS